MPKNLDCLTIHRFRGIVELQLEQLGQVNLFVGPNNSGKTSVLEAIATFSRPLDPSETFRAIRRREIKSTRQPLSEGLRWMFPQTPDSRSSDSFLGQMRISGRGAFSVRESVAECEEVLAYESGPQDYEEEEESESSLSESFHDEEIVTALRLSAIVDCGGNGTAGQPLVREFEFRDGQRIRVERIDDDPALPVAVVSPFAHRVEQIQVQQLTALRIDQKKQALVEILGYFDSDVQDIEILSRQGIRASIYLQHRRLGLAPLSSFGDGMRRALTIAMNLVSAPGGNLLIDEIEASIHTSVLGPLFKWLVRACGKANVQLFATTHSLEAVDAIISAVDESDRGEIVGYHLDAGPDKSIARRFDGDLLHGLRFEGGLDVR